MSLSKFSLAAGLITLVALAYVHQQVELVKLNYSINHNRDSLSVLLDQNTSLMYNVTNLQSPLYLEQSLSANNVNIEIPSRWHSIAFAEPGTVK